jgi:hypothetical protein
VRSPVPYSCDPRIEWVQAHGARKAFNRRFRLAQPELHPAALRPCLRQIGIEHKRTIDQAGAYIEIASNIRQRPSAGDDCDGVILAKLNRPPSEPRHFNNLVGRSCNPGLSLGIGMALGGAAMR